MFKIGDFSKISRVPVKTLRYYDQLGLLRPVEVDSLSGYRYYAADQLPRLNRILALKDLGLSLRQIRALLDCSLNAAELRGMLLRRQAEIEQRVRQEGERLARVEARLKLIETEENMPDYEIVIKQVPPLRVASVRGIIPAYPEQGELWNALESELARQRFHGSEPCFTMYHDAEYREKQIDAEVCEPVGNAPVQSSGRIKVYELPAITAAAVVHHGSFATLPNAYKAVLKWIDENGYRICGPEREIYIYTGKGPVRQDDPSYVTEVQFPVEKKS
jgi:DNA-binding transcriptional MerR regulator